MPGPVLHQDTESTLVEHSKEGDTRAFDQIILMYGKRLFELAYHMTSHTEVADELLHEIFSRVLGSLHQFRKPMVFEVWIYQIALDTILNSLKKREKISGLNLCLLDEGIQNDNLLCLIAQEINPIQGLDFRELQKKMNVGFLQLPPTSRMLVILVDIQGMIYEKAARILRISEKTLRTRLQIAHLELKSQLTDYLI